MNPEDSTYMEFVEAVEECVRELADEHGIEADVTVEEGEISIVSLTGETEDGKPIEMSTAVSADLAENLHAITDQIGVNDAVDLPAGDAVLPRLSTEGRNGLQADFGDRPGADHHQQPEFEDRIEQRQEQTVPNTRPLRSKEEIAHECDRLEE